MTIKILFSAISIIIGLWAFYPYLKGVVLKQVQPHAFTWLVWGITQGTATAGLWIGGGGIGTLFTTLGTILVLLIFFLSLKNGMQNVTKSDVLILLAALAAIAIWWFLKNPVLAVLMVSGIDLLGYLPTFRKSYHHPWSESLQSWTGFTVGTVVAILALENYNLLTLSYLVTIASADALLVCFLLLRRRCIAHPVQP